MLFYPPPSDKIKDHILCTYSTLLSLTQSRGCWIAPLVFNLLFTKEYFELIEKLSAIAREFKLLNFPTVVLICMLHK